MANIQNRLLEARYGSMNIRMPDNNDIILVPKLSQYDLKKLNITKTSENILSLYLNPPKKDKYFRTNHHKIVTDYYTELKSSGSLNSLKTLVTQKLIRKLIYYYQNHNIYGNSFDNYAIPWCVGGLFAMRHYTMRRMRERCEIPNIHNFSSPNTNGWYPLVKPMLPKTTTILAYAIHRELEQFLDYYRDKYKIVC